jgi:hypothetical protein
MVVLAWRDCGYSREAFVAEEEWPWYIHTMRWSYLINPEEVVR